MHNIKCTFGATLRNSVCVLVPTYIWTKWAWMEIHWIQNKGSVLFSPGLFIPFVYICHCSMFVMLCRIYAIFIILHYTFRFFVTSGSGSTHAHPWILLPLDIPFEYWIEHITFRLLCVMFRFSTRIFYRGVPGFETDCPCGVWCRGLTTCPEYVGPPFGNLGWSNSRFVSLTYWGTTFSMFLIISTYILMHQNMIILHFRLPKVSNIALFFYIAL